MSAIVKMIDVMLGIANLSESHKAKELALDAVKEHDDHKRFMKDALLGLAEWKLQHEALALELKDTKGWLLLREKQLAECTRTMREVAGDMYRADLQSATGLTWLLPWADRLMEVRAKASQGRFWLPEQVEKLFSIVSKIVPAELHERINAAFKQVEIEVNE